MSSTIHFNRSLNSLVGILALGLGCLSLPALAAHSGCEDRVNTQAYTFSVTLPDNNTYEVAGFMYWQGQLEGKVLQIALHGATYNHKYWDADELNGHPYSYARYMACHGFAVLALDNLGVGASSRPDGDFVNVPLQVLAVHQIIQGLGSAPVEHNFRKIVLVGHSMGSLAAVFLQGTFHDVDALVVTGWANTPHTIDGLSAEAFGALLAEQYVAFPGFLRTFLFYAGDFDPAMPDWDNANLADVAPRGALTYGFAAMFGLQRTMAEGVTGPVLVVLPEYDLTMPLSLAANEPSTYPNASSVTIDIAYGVGHDLNLHRGNVEAWARMKTWIRENVGGNAD